MDMNIEHIYYLKPDAIICWEKWIFNGERMVFYDVQFISGKNISIRDVNFGWFVNTNNKTDEIEHWLAANSLPSTMGEWSKEDWMIFKLMFVEG